MQSYRTSIERVGERTDELEITFHEVESGQFPGRLPAHFVKDEVDGLTFESGDAEKDQKDGIVARVRVLVARDFLACGSPNAQFLFELALQRLPRRFAGLHLTAWELPFQCVGLLRGAAANQNPPIPLEDRRYHLNHATIGSYVYPDRLLEQFQHPRNVGDLAPPAVTVEVSNPACGDILRLAVRLEGGVAAEVRYKVRGCTASIAAGSALTEWIAGKTLDQIAAFIPAVVDEAVGGLPAESKHAAALCADGVKALMKRLVRP